MFRISAEARAWRNKIIDSPGKAPIFNDEWDLYYLALLFGLTNSKKEINTEFCDMYKNFIKKYKDSKDVIMTLLIISHANRRELDLSKKEVLEEVLNYFYDSDGSESGLSADAIKQMNYYAAGGFKIIEELVPHYSNVNSGAAIELLHKNLKQSMDEFSKVTI